MTIEVKPVPGLGLAIGYDKEDSLVVLILFFAVIFTRKRKFKREY
tara:strand:- start:559 stop:693 length:135 start_codon:yes stop_codon:yes gene_type:complete